MKRNSIRQKLLWLTMAPPLILLIVILVYFIDQDNKLMHESLHARGEMVSRYLASAAEYAVITGNTQQLQHISDSVLGGDIVAMAVYDFDGVPIFMRGQREVERDMDNANHEGLCGAKGSEHLYCAPINLDAMPISDYEAGDESSVTTIGRVELVLTTHIILQKRRDMMFGSLILTLFIISIAVLLSRRAERQLVEPMSSIGEAVDKVRHGVLDVELKETASGELLTLQQGVNVMIRAIADAQKGMQQEINRATESLRTTLLELEKRNDELQSEQQRAETASLAKSQFLATMSHEIRTPLSGIIGMLQLLRDRSVDPQQQGYIDSLEESTQSLRRLIDDILDFSRLEVGKLAIQRQAFDPIKIIEEVMVMLTPSAHHKGLEFVLDVDGAFPTEVVSDSLRFRQVLINLTANAIKFTHSGEVVLRAHVLRQTGECFCRFEICDSGIGIPDDKREMVFDSFTQIDDGDARNYGGSGLGATVSRELVQMMKGDIGFDSELGKGSCFWFELPWKCGADTRGDRCRGDGLSVLLLESHSASSLAISHLLELGGMGVDCVSSEESLWLALAERDYSWVVIDENSFKQTTPSLANKLSTKLGSGTRIIQLRPINSQRAKEENIEYINKPLLPSIISKLMESGGAPEQRPHQNTANRPLSVLLAEDDAINAKVISYFLEQGGHQVTVVADGQTALEKLRNGHYDCVLMDMRMPGMDGLEATRSWRSEEGELRLPIIALTANASDEDRQRCSEAGMDDYLTKPVESGALLATLERHCCKSRFYS